MFRVPLYFRRPEKPLSFRGRRTGRFEIRSRVAAVRRIKKLVQRTRGEGKGETQREREREKPVVLGPAPSFAIPTDLSRGNSDSTGFMRPENLERRGSFPATVSLRGEAKRNLLDTKWE